jgi:O-methyltransferase
MSSILGEVKLQALRGLMARAAHVPGSVAECGVYRGGTLSEMLRAFPGRTVYGFDTFEGLPEQAWAPGEVHSPGDFADVPGLEEIARGAAGARLVPGIFPESADGIEGPFAFVHVDFDFEASTVAAIDWFVPRMSPGGLIVFDDYKWEHCPGVERAITAAGLAITESAEYQCFWVAP